MEKTSNVYPVPWKKILSRIRQSDGDDVLSESKYIYLMFLITYWLVEFPALRLVIAYDFVTKNKITTSDRVGLAAVRVLIALVFLPLFLAVWMILVIWSIFHWTANKIWTLLFHLWRDAEEQSDKRSTEEHSDKPSLHQEKRRSGEGDGDRENKDSKEAEHQNEKNIRQARDEKEDRVRKQVSLLLNPRKLYQDKLEPYHGKIKAMTSSKKKDWSERRKKSDVSDRTLSV